MTWLSRDEEIRAIAAKISVQYCGLLTSGLLSSGRDPTDLEPLSIAQSIEDYIKTGTLPGPMWYLTEEVTK